MIKKMIIIIMIIIIIKIGSSGMHLFNVSQTTLSEAKHM